MVAASSIACASLTHNLGRQSGSRGAPLFEVDSVTYDGSELNARVLVGARGGPIVVDRRFEEGVTVDVRDVRECASGDLTGSIIEDVFLPKATRKDFVEISPGEWIGADMNFLIFAPELGTRHGPECIRVRLLLFLTPSRAEGDGGAGDAALEIEVHRTGASGHERDGGEDGGRVDAGRLDAGALEQPGSPARVL